MSEGKDTVYVDIDDEITGVIDKVRASKHKIVALVLPKRATMMQSTVNMRLLKRAAKAADKNIVLITSEAGLLPLAGAAGLHVAKSLESKPIIPPLPKIDDETETVPVGEMEVDPTKSVGELAGLPPKPEKEAVIQVDNDDLSSAGAAAEEVVSKDNLPKSKKFKIPNFDRFRTRLFLIGAGILLFIGLMVWAFAIAPKAKITIKTDTSTTLANTDFTAKSGDTTLDLTNNIVGAQVKSVKKTQSEKVPATGEKNVGDKAKGTVSLKNCAAQDGAVTVPAGTGVSTNSGSTAYTFITQEEVTLPASSFSGGGSCQTATKTVNVTAQNAGGQYNLSGGRTFSVAGFAGVTGVDSSAMAGGTDKFVKVVSEADIEAAKAKTAAASGGIAEELQNSLSQEGFVGLPDTLSNDPPAITSTPKVGEEASEVTVNIEVTYTLMGVKESDLKQIIEAAVAGQINTAQQKVINHGLDEAVFRVLEKKSATELRLNLQTLATIGPQFDEANLKKEVAGKKRGDAEKLIGSRPGVKEVRVELSPFWVSKIPKNPKKTTLVIE